MKLTTFHVLTQDQIASTKEIYCLHLRVMIFFRIPKSLYRIASYRFRFCVDFTSRSACLLEIIMTDEDYMRIALQEAKAAAIEGEIPVGAVLVHDGSIIARARNANRASHDPTRHAELDAIRLATRAFGNERLLECKLFVTKEPCAMCAGAIVHARIKRLIIGARDEKYGACGSVLSVCGNEKLNHVPQIVFGVLEKESSLLLRQFFEELRQKNIR